MAKVRYTVDCEIEANRVDDWLDYMLNKHIQDVLDTGFFLQANIYEILEGANSEGCRHYRIDYDCVDINAYRDYAANAAAPLQADHVQRFGKTVRARRSLCQHNQTFAHSNTDSRLP